MMNLTEYRRTASRLADYLPWAALVAPGVVLNKDGSFQRTAKFRGPDLASAVAAELVAVAGRLNNAFRRLGSGWAIFVEAQRREDSSYPESLFPDPASAMVDAERRADFEQAGSHFVSDYFLTLLWLPPAEEAARAESWLYEGRETAGVNPWELLRGFIDRSDRVLALLDGFMPECRWLHDAETLSYLHSTISTKRQRVRVPEIPMHLDALLADQPLTGGLEPRLGEQHLRVLTLNGFPGATTPGILDNLNRIAFPYRWSTRAILIDKVDATRLLTKIRRQWFAKRKSIAAILKEVMTSEPSALVDTDAANKAADADLALQELGADMAGMGYVTATITVWDQDARIADEKLRLVEKIVQGRDFTAMIETVNAVDAWLGSLPGHAYDPTNHAENLLTAARTLEQINNQIASLQNEARMLINQARNLESLPHSSLQQLQQNVQQTRQLLDEAQNIAFDVEQVDQVFEREYGTPDLSMSEQQLIADARNRWRNTVGGLQDAMRVQAGVTGNIDANREEMAALVGESQGAVGALQATQAGNQLLALQSQQISDLIAVVSANGRADALSEAERATAAEQGRIQRQRFLTPGTGYQPGNARMFND